MSFQVRKSYERYSVGPPSHSQFLPMLGRRVVGAGLCLVISTSYQPGVNGTTSMDNVLTHKGYFSIVKYSPESEIFYGKIEAIVDLVSYEDETAKEVKAAFEEAVESYLETCAEVGKKPDKPRTGTFHGHVQCAREYRTVKRQLSPSSATLA